MDKFVLKNIWANTSYSIPQSPALPAKKKTEFGTEVHHNCTVGTRMAYVRKAKSSAKWRSKTVPFVTVFCFVFFKGKGGGGGEEDGYCCCFVVVVVVVVLMGCSVFVLFLLFFIVTPVQTLIRDTIPLVNQRDAC